MKKVKIKVLSALVMIGILLIILIIGPYALFSAVFIVMVGSSFELTSARHNVLDPKTLTQKSTPLISPREIRIFTMLAILLLSYWDYITNFVGFYADPANYPLRLQPLNYITVPTLGIATVILVLFFTLFSHKSLKFKDITYLFTMIIFMSLAAQSWSYIAIRDMGKGSFIITSFSQILAPIFIITVTSACDTGAYFIGMRFGRKKLVPHISPNKTVEGALGGVAFGIIATMLFAFIPILAIPNFKWWYTIIVGIFITLIAPAGDLMFSSIKRSYDIKDFFNLIPGHGGLLDRVDSLLLTGIIFVIFDNILIKYQQLGTRNLFRLIVELLS
jgi:phosphatidate cytidylyltransferase